MFGAVLMSLMQSTVQGHTAREAMVSTPSPSTDDQVFDTNIIIGCLYLIAAIFVMSSQVVLQAITLRDFPASISLCAITSLLGSVITAMVQMAEDGTWALGVPTFTIEEMVAYSILVKFHILFK